MCTSIAKEKITVNLRIVGVLFWEGVQDKKDASLSTNSKNKKMDLCS